MSSKNLYDLIDEKFGVKTEIRKNRLTSTVGTSRTKILDNNPNRLAYILINLSSNSIFVLPDEEVSTTRGIQLQGGGSKFGMNYNDDFHLVGYE